MWLPFLVILEVSSSAGQKYSLSCTQMYLPEHLQFKLKIHKVAFVLILNRGHLNILVSKSLFSNITVYYWSCTSNSCTFCFCFSLDNCPINNILSLWAWKEKYLLVFCGLDHINHYIDPAYKMAIQDKNQPVKWVIYNKVTNLALL
jgi:hypothetical protein